MIAGAGRSIGSSVSAATGPLPSSGRPSGSTTRPSSADPTGTRSHVARASNAVASFDSVDIVEQDAADLVTLEHLREAELTVLEPQQLVEAYIGQAGDQRDAVRDFVDPADLLGLRRRAERRRPRARRLGQPCVGPVAVVSHRASSARMRSRSARQLFLTSRCGPRSSSPAISAGSVSNAIVGSLPKASPISLR